MIDGESDMPLPMMVLKWQSAWQSLDPETVAALYAPDGTHMSDGVVKRMGKSDGTLCGPDELRAYALASVARLQSFRIDILDVISQTGTASGRAAVEYWRVVNGDEAGRTRVVEILEWSDDRISACRVFHF
ncbi:MAG: nuclear transport factor 2 family protein [Parvibaculum sp.]|uniref:nuclear transport factor 2 family protein n=2 Tax=Parvibaculum sp. TaxID=2024848 RepID=UPI001B07B892|nr:nuclear transport factor 2 family protein [Parvibaculum sp.]MBO6686188.1 nuclear transport factor 2 family protein [Parvibaculum sp.]